MLSRRVTSFVSNLLNKSPRSLWKMKRCRFHRADVIRARKKKDEDGPKIVKPGNCVELPKPILEAACKNAIVIGGSEGFGFTAADHLLCNGARNVVLLDEDAVEGQNAARKLCDAHGKNRLLFVHCDIRTACQFEAGLRQALCKLRVIHILFNDLDKERLPSSCSSSKKIERNFTAKTIRAGLKILGKNHGGSGGIIINCASIFGFMGWPEAPFPVYCRKEAAIEVTQDFADEHDIEETGVRLVALCPTDKQFCDIGLPDNPDEIPNRIRGKMPECIPKAKYHIGTALDYVLAWAQNGSAWLVEPAISAHQIPRLIHFPENEDEEIDPKVYETEPCTVNIEPPCADTSKACSTPTREKCVAKTPKKK
ncbi:PREDICTED: uncharacterized protein LOC108575616 [Habropoda laboriosa]|uniref:uncharacterized protein LOC108575616 n=1 Tax=Habropoda laboriosa TaxID=597456 RepID=UPI00083E65BE|nr:PREDICTED: uncharacterized protein LOC108575616 [Habropoda laboriosa]